jgi:hypothetical protein
VRQALERALELLQVLAKIVEGLLVGLEATALGVGDEDHPVDVREDEATGGVVIELPRHRVELEAHRDAANLPRPHRQVVEMERAILLRGDAHHLAAVLRPGGGEEALQRRGLAAQPRAIEHELERQLPRMGVQRGHGVRLVRGRDASAYSVRALAWELSRGRRSTRVPWGRPVRYCRQACAATSICTRTGS